MARRGFTLLELLVVIAIVAIVSGGALLGWRRLDAALTLDRAVHQLAADLQEARSLAVASAGRVRLVFVPGTPSYRRERADDDGDYATDRGRRLPRGITIAEANSGADLIFSARGDAENGTVALRDARGVIRRVRLNQRGRITVLEAGV